jgi:hypothetical protein
VAQSKQGRILPYHFGRLISYVVLGALSGLLGEKILSSELGWLRLLGFSLMSLLLILSGIAQWKSTSLLDLFGSLGSQRYHRLRARILNPVGTSSAFMIGLLTILLPCGWLYSFTLAAAATKSADGGGLIMFLFWLAGLPALSSMQLILRKGMGRSSKSLHRISALVLIAAGLYALTAHALIGMGFLGSH